MFMVNSSFQFSKNSICSFYFIFIKAISENAFSRLRKNNKNQSIIVGGESGAGKTECTKILLQYLAAVAGETKKNKFQFNVEDQILQANVLLEAFGNAKTVRNNNSSRYGKFIQIVFDSHFKISGSFVTNYLLEKSRIVFQESNERNYHIFFYLCASNHTFYQETYSLKPASQFKYLAKSGCLTIEGVDDLGAWKEVVQSFQVLGIKEEEQKMIFRILAAILHLGNIQFVAPSGKSKIEDTTSLKIVASLLGCQEKDLHTALCERTISARQKHSIYMVSLDLPEAEMSRDALSKHLYSALFDRLVEMINQKLQNKQINISQSNVIGILDIFGFEVFDINSFEQLCENFFFETFFLFFKKKC